MSEVIENTEVALRDLQECQSRHNVSSCEFCREAARCEKKESFEEMVVLNLQENTKVLQECQREQNFFSCLQCQKILDCSVRNRYVSAVYLSMNKGNGGSFEF